MTEHEFITRVLELFAQADAHGDLFWHVDTDHIAFSANVSDVFAWGGADAEPITPETLPVLEQAFADLKAIDAEHFTADLYAARIRGERPQGAAYPDEKTKSWREVSALLDACGPERVTGLGNPRVAPAHRAQPAAPAAVAAAADGDESDSLIEEYLQFLRGRGPEPDLSDLPPDRRAVIAGQFEIVKALADRDPKLPPIDLDPVARRLGLHPPAADRAGCTCAHPADEHSVYGCADGCGCEWMPRRTPTAAELARRYRYVATIRRWWDADDGGAEEIAAAVMDVASGESAGLRIEVARLNRRIHELEQQLAEAEAEVQRQHRDCQTAEAAVARVRQLADWLDERMRGHDTTGAIVYRDAASKIRGAIDGMVTTIDVPGGKVTFPAPITRDQADAFRDAFDGAHTPEAGR